MHIPNLVRFLEKEKISTFARQFSAAVTGTDIRGPRVPCANLSSASSYPGGSTRKMSLCLYEVSVPTSLGCMRIHWANTRIGLLHNTWHLVSAQKAGNKAYSQVLYHCQWEERRGVCGGGGGERRNTQKRALRLIDEVAVSLRGTLIFPE